VKLHASLFAAVMTLSQALAQNAVDPYMGDWKGTLTLDGKEQPAAAFLIPLALGHYEIKIAAEFNQRVLYIHHLRGVFEDGNLRAVDAIPFEASRVIRAAEGGVVVAASFWTGHLENGVLQGTIAGQKNGEFRLTQFQRPSPTLGKPAPAKAVVLFDGKNLDAWTTADGQGEVKWKIVEGDAMEVNGGNIKTKEKFGDHRLHLEFRTPYMPTSFGQGRGNSGVYLHARYEIQVLDSYGLSGEDNECGGIYQISKPAVNMCFPPLQWQAYDVTFFAPRFNKEGRKVANARLTVIHNGVTIHDNLELPKVTGGAISEQETTADSLLLQDHGNAVQFRNIWVQKLD